MNITTTNELPKQSQLAVAPTPETDAQLKQFTSISKLKRRFITRTGTVSAEFARGLERDRNRLLVLLHKATKEALSVSRVDSLPNEPNDQDDRRLPPKEPL
jgi:hypothetical protein